MAAELGLQVTQDPSIGWSVTSVPPVTRELYAIQVRRLEVALVAHRRREPHGACGRKPSNNGVAAECGCGRRIRVSRTVYTAAPIVCGGCGKAFTADSE